MQNFTDALIKQSRVEISGIGSRLRQLVDAGLLSCSDIRAALDALAPLTKQLESTAAKRARAARKNLIGSR